MGIKIPFNPFLEGVRSPFQETPAGRQTRGSFLFVYNSINSAIILQLQAKIDKKYFSASDVV
jgi:hypothetical protein